MQGSLTMTTPHPRPQTAAQALRQKVERVEVIDMQEETNPIWGPAGSAYPVAERKIVADRYVLRPGR